MVIVPLLTTPPPVRAPSVLVMDLAPRSAVPPETVRVPVPKVPLPASASVPTLTVVPAE